MSQPKQLTIDQAISLAQKETNQGNPAVALQLYKAILQKQPDHPIAKDSLHKLQQDLPQDQFSQTQTTNPSQDQLEALVGLYNSGQLPETERACKKLQQTYPQSLFVLNILGATLQGQGKFQEAVENFDKAIQLKPDYVEAYSNRGVALLELGQPEQAVKSCNEAIELKPDYAEAYYNRGNALKDIGQLEEAVKSYDEAIQLRPEYAQAYSNRGTSLQELGLFEEAVRSYDKVIQLKPDFTEAYSNRGNALKDLGRLEEAVESYDKAIKIKPGYAEAYNNRGIALKELGLLEDAVRSYDKVIQLKPEYEEAYNNRGNVLNDLGRLEEAIENYDKAVKFKPDYFEAHNNRGNTLKELELLEEAIDSYDDAIKFKPDYAEAYSNRGNALTEIGRLKEALKSHKKAIELKPDLAEAYLNSGVALKELGQENEAIAAYQKAISIDPENNLFWSGYANSLLTMKFTSCRDDLVSDFVQILERRTVSPRKISTTIINALQYHKTVNGIFELFKSGSVDENLNYLTAQLSTVPLLLRLIELSPIANLVMEKMFTEIRKSMLKKVTSDRDEVHGLPFYASLAMHCFTNEYVFSESEIEIRGIEFLQKEIKYALDKGEVIPPPWITVIGAYRQLSSFDWADDLLKIEWPVDIQKVIVIQLKNVKEEQCLRPKIPRLAEIEDKVSQLVRDQYEENPYPRWISTALYDVPKTIRQISNHIKLHLDFDVQKFPDKPDILIAGCGTGQHSVGTASRFLNCDVLAVDLSLSSLSYAARKTSEIGITNIKYMQGDILKLGQLKRQFDIIESVGVLHHMDDPMAGWRVLVDRLLTGGLMKIGLYSEIARQDIVAARKQIAKKKYTTAPEDIRQFRDDIINMDPVSDSEITKIKASPDFYSLSECRDLLFHVQEHRFTLPKIEAALTGLGLTFLGFEFADDKVRNRFRKLYPGKDTTASLSLWHQFELDNPDTFRGMYQFWLQKV